jgi:hypothetical protein
MTENTMEKSIHVGFSVDDSHQKPDFRAMETHKYNTSLFHPITLEELIGGRNFIVYNEQIIFYHEELNRFVITTIIWTKIISINRTYFLYPSNEVQSSKSSSSAHPTL